MTNLADKIDALADAANRSGLSLPGDPAWHTEKWHRDNARKQLAMLLHREIATLTRALRDAERMREALEFVWPATLVLQGMCQRIGCALGADKAAEMEVVIRQALGETHDR